MTKKTRTPKKKKPADLNQLALSIVEEATAEPSEKKKKSLPSSKSKKH